MTMRKACTHNYTGRVIAYAIVSSLCRTHFGPTREDLSSVNSLRLQSEHTKLCSIFDTFLSPNYDTVLDADPAA